VQVNPIKPTLKAPGIKLLKLEFDKPLSNFAFKFNLRRYTVGLTLGGEPEQSRESSLSHQSRTVRCFPDGTGTVSSIKCSR
jgi:hypothetical protein